MKQMKQTILIFILIAGESFGLHLHAQDRFLIGVSTQIHNTRLMVDYSSTRVKGAYRPSSVLFAEYEFGKHLGLHTGLGYTMMTQNSDAFKNNFHYLAMPLYLKIGRLKEDKCLAFTSFIGMDMHYPLKATHISLNGDRTDILDYTQKFHADLAGGAGVKFRLSNRFSMEALVSISHGSNISVDNAALMDINNLNTGFRINLSYKFK